MLKYKLIKEYPNSEKLGTIFSFEYSGFSTAGAVTEKGIQFNTSWTRSYFEKWLGEYFQVVE